MEPEEGEVYYEEILGPLYERVEVEVPKAVTTKKEKRYRCPVCNLKCSSPSTLRVHMRTHTGEKPYKCPECDYRAIAPYVLRGHMKVHIKTSDRRHACLICSYRTNYMTSLKVHMRSHTGERPYSCTECDYSTAYRNALLLHMSRHTEGPKRFSCEHCNYCTTQKHSLKLHVQARHSMTRPFKCDLCSFATKTKALLNAHNVTHSTEKPFACVECDFRTHKKQCLTRHMLRHTGDKPFQCGVCGFRTAHRYTMKTHIMRQHTGDLPDDVDPSSYPEYENHRSSPVYPYPCFICSERSLTPKDWRDHLAEHGRKSVHQHVSNPSSDEKMPALSVDTSLKRTAKPNWPCPLCGSGFALRSYLVRHITDRHPFRSSEERNAFLCTLKPSHLEKILTDGPTGDVIVKLEDVPKFVDCEIAECVVQDDTGEYSVTEYNPEQPTIQELTISETGEVVGLEEVFGEQVVYDEGCEAVTEECIIQFDDEGEFFEGDVQYIEVATEPEGQVTYV
ncbi:Hypothetical protein NTJ_11402 [Nesidiocoris tenuis]|uniref:C2H2-type domain-containing protein n=1 Tax=Nesidiocoris tenuis TaxID=355587 RepID=A0ABN7B2D8_9HEMI|nr:Hypothetical protein NTJ_11402 [Nesidiocoris tenuis]